MFSCGLCLCVHFGVVFARSNVVAANGLIQIRSESTAQLQAKNESDGADFDLYRSLAGLGGQTIQWKVRSTGAIEILTEHESNEGNSAQWNVQGNGASTPEAVPTERFCGRTVEESLQEAVNGFANGGRVNAEELIEMIEMPHPVPPASSCSIPQADRPYSDSECTAASDIFTGARSKPYFLVDGYEAFAESAESGA